MSRTVIALALALIGLLGLAARVAPIVERRLPAEARDLGASRWVVDDPSTALHLRRIELALAEGRVPSHDPFLAQAAPAEIPALPVFDALIAGFAERWLTHVGGDRSLGGVDEADLESFTAWFGPVLYLLAFAAFLWTAAILLRGAHGGIVLAALVFALTPIGFDAGQVGRIDAAALGLVLAVLLVRGTQVAVRAEDALSTILEALLCGVIAGLLTSMSAAGPILALPTGAALFLRATRGPVEVRPIALRAGLLFTLVAAFVARLPLADGPWEQLPEGLVARWSLAASDMLLLSAAPFALLLLTAPRDAAHKSRTFARIVALAAMLALLLFELPRAWNAASGPIEAWWAARSILPGSGLLERMGGVSFLCLAGIPLVGWQAWQQRDVARFHIFAFALVTTALVLVSRDFAPFFVLGGAAALASIFPASHFERRPRWWIAGVAGLLGVAATVHVFARPSPADRESRLAWIAALRWIRAEVPPGGPFNSSSARSTWGILADPRDGEIVAYHARRPVLGSGAGAFSHPDLAREALLLTTSTGIDEVVERMRVQALRLVVQRGIDVDPVDFADDGPFALARRNAGTPDLQRVFVSDTWARLAGEERMPAAVVWSLTEVEAPRTPVIRPPR